MLERWRGMPRAGLRPVQRRAERHHNRAAGWTDKLLFLQSLWRLQLRQRLANKRGGAGVHAGASLSWATGSPINTSSSAAVGWTAQVASHCALVSCALTPIAAI